MQHRLLAAVCLMAFLIPTITCNCTSLVKHCFEGFVNQTEFTRKETPSCCEFAARVECMVRYDAVRVCRPNKELGRWIKILVKQGLKDTDELRGSFWGIVREFAEKEKRAPPTTQEIQSMQFPRDCESSEFTNNQVSDKCKGAVQLMTDWLEKPVTEVQRNVTTTAPPEEAKSGMAIMIGIGVCILVMIVALLFGCYLLYRQRNPRNQPVRSLGKMTQN